MRRKNPPGIGLDASGGIWYYIWLAPKWLRHIERDEMAQHISAWTDRIITMLVEHYELGPNDENKLFALFRSMPRGRVITEGYGESFSVAHGDDFPNELSTIKELDDIVREFGLPLRKVRFAYQPHETMSSEHKKAIQQIIGKVPY